MVEMSTGETIVTKMSHITSTLLQTLLKNNIREIVVGSDINDGIKDELDYLTLEISAYISTFLDGIILSDNKLIQNSAQLFSFIFSNLNFLHIIY